MSDAQAPRETARPSRPTASDLRAVVEVRRASGVEVAAVMVPLAFYDGVPVTTFVAESRALQAEADRLGVRLYTGDASRPERALAALTAEELARNLGPSDAG